MGPHLPPKGVCSLISRVLLCRVDVHSRVPMSSPSYYKSSGSMLNSPVHNHFSSYAHAIQFAGDVGLLRNRLTMRYHDHHPSRRHSTIDEHLVLGVAGDSRSCKSKVTIAATILIVRDRRACEGGLEGTRQSRRPSVRESKMHFAAAVRVNILRD